MKTPNVRTKRANLGTAKMLAVWIKADGFEWYYQQTYIFYTLRSCTEQRCTGYAPQFCWMANERWSLTIVQNASLVPTENILTQSCRRRWRKWADARLHCRDLQWQHYWQTWIWEVNNRLGLLTIPSIFRIRRTHSVARLHHAVSGIFR